MVGEMDGMLGDDDDDPELMIFPPRCCYYRSDHSSSHRVVDLLGFGRVATGDASDVAFGSC